MYSRRMLPHIVAASLAAIALVGSVAMADPIWSYKADADIQFQKLTPLGSLMVSTGSGLMALDAATGNVLWTNAELKNLKECNYDELANSQYGSIEARRARC